MMDQPIPGPRRKSLRRTPTLRYTGEGCNNATVNVAATELLKQEGDTHVIVRLEGDKLRLEPFGRSKPFLTVLRILDHGGSGSFLALGTILRGLGLAGKQHLAAEWNDVDGVLEIDLSTARKR